MTIELQFPDGAVRSYEPGVTGRAIAESLSKSLAKKAMLVRVDGRLLDLDRAKRLQQAHHFIPLAAVFTATTPAAPCCAVRTAASPCGRAIATRACWCSSVPARFTTPRLRASTLRC